MLVTVFWRLRGTPTELRRRRLRWNWPSRRLSTIGSQAAYPRLLHIPRIQRSDRSL